MVKRKLKFGNFNLNFSKKMLLITGGLIFVIIIVFLIFLLKPSSSSPGSGAGTAPGTGSQSGQNPSTDKKETFAKLDKSNQLYYSKSTSVIYPTIRWIPVPPPIGLTSFSQIIQMQNGSYALLGSDNKIYITPSLINPTWSVYGNFTFKNVTDNLSLTLTKIYNFKGDDSGYLVAIGIAADGSSYIVFTDLKNLNPTTFLFIVVNNSSSDPFINPIDIYQINDNSYIITNKTGDIFTNNINFSTIFITANISILKNLSNFIQDSNDKITMIDTITTGLVQTNATGVKTVISGNNIKNFILLKTGQLLAVYNDNKVGISSTDYTVWNDVPGDNASQIIQVN